MSAIVDLNEFRQRRRDCAPSSLLHELMRECVVEVQELRRKEDAEEEARLLRHVRDVQRQRSIDAEAAEAKRHEETRGRATYPPAVEKEIRLLTRVAGHRFSAEGRSDYTPAECRAVAIAELLQRAADSAAKRPRKKK